ncbi:DM13 domain-containing protein [Paraglaciecola aquimarina]|uniref:DM13 domain-containing protein n=1 Tax=Paraglaciecola aquimarina TaxID=1235557 RepID=A0ABU3SSS3_9ALTE|nr:DM13 domain-containing protein [Paraglaciecola aquimarina]MDU0353071.1 DM13 domain-containing protein [Paraglaciecola aquimarina]
MCVAKVKHLSLLFFTAMVISSCGGGSDSAAPVISNPPIQPTTPTEPEPSEPTVLTGQFIDSAVQGLAFHTASQSGTTDADGYFSYVAGETVTFSIGDLDFPPVMAKQRLTPLDVFAVTDLEDVRVQNMARLLQTLDVDGMPANGITISDDAHNQAMGVTVDFASDDFAQQVESVVANAGAANTSLITSQAAIDHLRLSLANISANSGSCATATAKQGYVGEFSTLAHEVSGFARIVDNCTIEVSMFNFDGQAPNVRFYGGLNSTFTGPDSFGIGQRIEGQRYANETIILRLPSGKTMEDLDSLSVWCVDFNADFGSLVFTKP